MFIVARQHDSSIVLSSVLSAEAEAAAAAVRVLTKSHISIYMIGSAFVFFLLVLNKVRCDNIISIHTYIRHMYMYTYVSVFICAYIDYAIIHCIGIYTNRCVHMYLYACVYMACSKLQFPVSVRKSHDRLLWVERQES